MRGLLGRLRQNARNLRLGRRVRGAAQAIRGQGGAGLRGNRGIVNRVRTAARNFATAYAA
jgi:hypothetical protein